MLAVVTAVLVLPLAFSPFNASAEGGLPPVPPDALLSLNWAGYVRVGDTYNDVRASWVQPSADCEDQDGPAASFWVGMGGVFSPNLEQIGTEVVCVRGKAQYSTWLEMLPNPIQRLPLKLRAGDSVSASVHFASGVYTLTLTTKSGGTYAHSFSTDGDNTSVEWITEAPANCDATGCTVIPLADFGSVRFGHATSTPNTGQTLEIVMVAPTAAPLAIPTSFEYNQFTVLTASSQLEQESSHQNGNEKHQRLNR